MNDCSGSDLRHSIRADHPDQQALDQVILFQDADGQVSLDVRLEGDTVWLSQALMAELFGRERSVITRHMGQRVSGGRAGQARQCAFFAHCRCRPACGLLQPRCDHLRGLPREVAPRHPVPELGLGELEQAVGLMARTLSSHGLVSDEGQKVLEVVQRYSRPWRWLRAYDEDRLPPITAEPDGSPEALGLEEAQWAIETHRADLACCGEATPLFGQDTRQARAGILGAIEQTFDGQPLYPTAPLRAAHLLYFVIKDHPFANGNKRIGALLFLEFLRRHQLLLLADGQPRIADNGMAALALLEDQGTP